MVLRTTVISLVVFSSGLFAKSEKIYYGEQSRQWLRVYHANPGTVTPVYIWAHGNNFTADSVTQFTFIDSLKEIGVSVISWESHLNMNVSNFLEVMEDGEKMFAWFKANAAGLDLDPNNVVIGGHSRGTIASWNLAQSGDPGIKGIYYIDVAGALDPNNPLVGDLITPESPRIEMNYNNTGGTSSADNVHDPINGVRMKEFYANQGIGERVMFREGLKPSNVAWPSDYRYVYQFINQFCESVFGSNQETSYLDISQAAFARRLATTTPHLF